MTSFETWWILKSLLRSYTCLCVRFWETSTSIYITWYEDSIRESLQNGKKKAPCTVYRSVLPSAGWGDSRQDDKLCLCVYVQWMSSLCVLFSMTAQTDGVWPLVWGVEDPAMTYSRADVAERRPHSTGIVQTLRAETEIGRDADTQTDTCCLCAFSYNVRSCCRETLSSLLWGDLKTESRPQNGSFSPNLLMVRKKTSEVLII